MAQTLDFTAFAVVSKWRDSNPRPFGPEGAAARAGPLLMFHFAPARPVSCFRVALFAAAWAAAGRVGGGFAPDFAPVFGAVSDGQYMK